MRQDDPKMQVRAILGSIEGDLSNLRAGICKDPSAVIERAFSQVQEVHGLIAAYMKECEWADPTASPCNKCEQLTAREGGTCLLCVAEDIGVPAAVEKFKKNKDVYTGITPSCLNPYGSGEHHFIWSAPHNQFECSLCPATRIPEG